MKRQNLAVIGIVCLLVGSLIAPVEGKRRRSIPPLTILNVTATPDPFPVERDTLTLAVDVKLPRTVQMHQVLEVSSLIASPSRRSIRFLSHRLPIRAIDLQENGRTIQATLVWDGKDQTRDHVPPGRYQYRVRAKLMEDRGNGLQAKLVSPYVRGTITVVRSPDADEEGQHPDSEPGELEDEPPPEDLTEEEALEEDQEEQSDGEDPIPEEENQSARSDLNDQIDRSLPLDIVPAERQDRPYADPFSSQPSGKHH